jgi:hypothetical protein
MVSLVSQWESRIGLFLALDERTKIPAGDIYEAAGLPRLKKHRCPMASVAVKAFMRGLGWYYRDNGTQPYFAESKPRESLILIKQVSNETIVSS